MKSATARHILVKQSKLAAKIKKEILAGTLTFEKAAKKYSRCSSKKQNGNLGTFKEGEMVEEAVFVDEFDPDEAINSRPDNAIKPYASATLSFDMDNSSYVYNFSHLPVGNYTVAFSCSAVGDSADEYDAIDIANPQSQKHSITIETDIDLIQNFTES